MLDFLIDNFNFITYGFEFIAVLTGLIFFKRYKKTTVKIFIIFLVYTIFVEFMGAFLVYFRTFSVIRLIRSLGFSVNIWFNIFWLFGSILFVSYYYHSLLKQKRHQIVVRILVVLFSVLMFLHITIYPQLFIKTHPPFYLISGLIVTSSSITLYFIELLKGDAILNILRTFGFYVSSGLLVWWLVITPVLFFDLYNTSADWDFANLKRFIFLFANIFMYSCFTIGLIVSNPKND